MEKQTVQDARDSELGKARKKVEAANKWRLAFLFIALLVLLFVFWGEKLWGEAAWFETARARAYLVALADLAAMFISTFAKLFFAVRYNRLLKE